jgi:hypothetical protein
MPAKDAIASLAARCNREGSNVQEVLKSTPREYSERYSVQCLTSGALGEDPQTPLGAGDLRGLRDKA